ncbi:MAG: hypothetical protein LBU65_15675 [Planctomycetaceae bacterium]|jgi:hypothetical protein|nr:hypothetical protein [Planctomycetaceae bacterium]
MKYQLPCQCGLTIAVETSQAGGQVVCSCGQQIQVPSLIKLKQLPPDDNLPVVSAEHGVNPRMILLFIGLALLAGTIAFGCYVYEERPIAYKVLEKPVGKILDGRIRNYNSTPVSQEEYVVLATNPEYILVMTPFQAYQYLDVLGPDLQMGFNFQENYQILKDTHTFLLILLAVLSVITLVVLVVVPFVPTSLKPQ